MNVKYKDTFVAYDSALRPYDQGASRVWEDGRVEITEKVDGSQMAFGFLDGEMCVRSRGAVIYPDNVQSLFAPAMNYLFQIDQDIAAEFPNHVFYGETLAKPKHNTITYGRVPRGFIMLFGMRKPDGSFATRSELADAADSLGLDVAPLIFSGPAAEAKALVEGTDLMTRTSYYGNSRIEGFIVRNLDVRPVLAGRERAFLAVKYVSDAFKELNKATWTKENTGKGRLETFLEEFAAPARWLKALQRAEEQGTLTNTAHDIGPLLKSIQGDVLREEEAYIKQRLFDIFKCDIARKSTHGFPEWLKARMLAKETGQPVDKEVEEG